MHIFDDLAINWRIASRHVDTIKEIEEPSRFVGLARTLGVL